MAPCIADWKRSSTMNIGGNSDRIAFSDSSVSFFNSDVSVIDIYQVNQNLTLFKIDTIDSNNLSNYSANFLELLTYPDVDASLPYNQKNYFVDNPRVFYALPYINVGFGKLYSLGSLTSQTHNPFTLSISESTATIKKYTRSSVYYYQGMRIILSVIRMVEYYSNFKLAYETYSIYHTDFKLGTDCCVVQCCNPETYYLRS